VALQEHYREWVRLVRPVQQRRAEKREVLKEKD
jgi:hypothetical protein